MANDLAPLLIAGILSAIFAWRLRPFLQRTGVSIQSIRSRDIHTKPTPRLGGVAIILAFILVVGWYLLFAPARIALTTTTLFGIDKNMLGVLFGVIVLWVTGIVDDIFGLPAWVKLLAQVFAAALLPLFGVRIQWLTAPLGGANIVLAPLIDSLLVIGWVVLIVNVVNFIDGLDGLATGTSAIALAVLGFLSIAAFVSQPALALIMFIALGACLGFLPFNWHPASIFLGDSGSQTLGYLIGVGAIVSGGKLATAALVMGIPIFDALWTVGRRLYAGKSPFVADRFHLHHRLLALGLPQQTVVTLLLAASGVLGAIALTSRTSGKMTTLLLLLAVGAVGYLLLKWLERRKQLSEKS